MFVYPLAGKQMEIVEERQSPEEVVRLPDGLNPWGDRIPIWTDLGRQGFRFVLVGGFVAGIYVGTTTFLAEVIRIPFEVALAIGFTLAVVTHFILQRLYVWRDAAAFALSLNHQVARYLAMAGLQYGLTATITASLPHVFGVSPEVVYVPTALALSVTNFLVFRSRIFHATDQLPRIRSNVLMIRQPGADRVAENPVARDLAAQDGHIAERQAAR